MCLMQFLDAEAWGGKKFLECKDCPIKAECPKYEPKEQTERGKDCPIKAECPKYEPKEQTEREGER